MSTTPVHGEPPSLVGRTLSAIVAQSFVCHGDLVTGANALFIECAGRWFRLVLDAGTVHWKNEAEAPKPWSVPEEGWVYPHRAVGEEFGLVGVPVAGISMQEDGSAIHLVIAFADGRQLILSNVEDTTSFRVA